MTPLSTESTTARATAACAGPNICTACFAPLIVTLLKRSVSGLAGRFGATTARSVVKPSLLFESALQKAAPAGPVLEPMIRSTCATSLPSPTSDSPRKKSAAIFDRSFIKVNRPREYISEVHHLNRATQTVNRIASGRRPPFVCDVAVEAELGNGLRHETVIELLPLVDLVPAGHAGGMEMSNQREVL